MDKIVYICTGSCKAEISEAEYKKGLKKCGAQGCTMNGHAFEIRRKCSQCGEYYKPGVTHSHIA